jgi:nucleotide-binding universal stress UspA family protein
MFDHALLALDLSPAGEDIIEAIPALAALGVRTCTLVHVDRILDDPLPGSVAAHPRAVMAEYEARARDTVPEGTLEILADLRLGDPASELLRAAAESGASLLVMGSRSQSRIAEAFMGSVAREVMESSFLPVLLLHVDRDGRLHPKSSRQLFERILCVTDFSPTAERALDLTLEMAAPAGCPVTVMHATPWALGEDVEAEGAMEELGERFRNAGIPDVRTLMVHQEPARAILDTAEAEAASLLVMGTQGRGFLGRAVLGSVSAEVTRRWMGPALLVPAPLP